ncbi:unnamed protein product, partial [Chrysoparadoxa australica]
FNNSGSTPFWRLGGRTVQDTAQWIGCEGSGRCEERMYRSVAGILRQLAAWVLCDRVIRAGS